MKSIMTLKSTAKAIPTIKIVEEDIIESCLAVGQWRLRKDNTKLTTVYKPNV